MCRYLYDAYYQRVHNIIIYGCEQYKKKKNDKNNTRKVECYNYNNIQTRFLKKKHCTFFSITYIIRRRITDSMENVILFFPKFIS